MDRALIIVSALVLNVLLAGPRPLYIALGAVRLSRFPAKAVRGLERRLNRDHRSEAEREARGMILVLTAALGSLILGWLLGWLFQKNLAEILIVMLALPVRPAWDIASGIGKKLKAGDANGAKQVLAGTPWRHYAVLDEYGAARAGIETLAASFSEKILAPVFWYLLFGLPGLFLSKAVYLLRETLPPDLAFSEAARTAHMLLHYIPSRLAAILWLLASLFLPSSEPRIAAGQIMPKWLAAPPLALSLLSAAGVLKLSLGGPVSVYAKEWQGNGNPRPLAADVRRALRLFALLHLLLLILVGLFF
ncbi:MAG: cobalamin biosynthesis protein [Pseudomonadota bacterium]|nr:cobalamin biosynthesis protein [Pseudomonadota bacterium]